MPVMDTRYEGGYKANSFSDANSVMNFFFNLVEDKCIKYIQYWKSKIQCETPQLPFWMANITL